MQAVPEPIAVVGSGCRFPGGSNSPSKLWELLENPRDLSTKVPNTRFNVDKFYHSEATHHGTTNATKSYFLDEDVSQFDAGFFNLQPLECEAIDPQQRLLLETVYDSLCSAGLRMERLRGSSTAVYVGMMCDDWSTMVASDSESLPTYAATGTARSIASNRISYFFDWHGPSMTIDTACSSSLVAVHHAVQALRNRESEVAVAAGTNLILSPNMYISETNLRMLSPTGRCAMWDTGADGYARGEGVATVVLKTLRQALADGDHIECVIRETGVNQDGRTTGLTMPSNLAQAALIRETYRRAGLDIRNAQDRPQFFHAHGTGTQAGDPQEAEAISSSLFPTDFEADQKLFVGSIKTVIGHTEGCAGLASLIGTSLALQKGIIPPNLHFSSLSPTVEPFFTNLHIPTNATPWPKVRPGQARRASINSFGFGGTNAHAIVEAYEPTELSLSQGSKPALFTPLTFSAASERALLTMLSDHSAYIRSNPNIGLSDLAWTLQDNRSILPYRKAIFGANRDAILNSLTPFEGSTSSEHPELGVRQLNNSGSPQILGVFTGQGAQWARMGAALVESSPFAKRRIAELDRALQSLPQADRPNWSILDELCADADASRIAEAALSQPLCTAVQILLVDILRSAEIGLTAVVGHSSGEISAAYSAGLLSDTDAMRISYYRGLYAKLAASPNGSKGSMMAVGMSHEDALAFCQQEAFLGRIAVAAVNSSSSITLSGDIDAIDEAHGYFKDREIFARKLKVDTAYHSAHMLPCSGPYLNSMRRVLIKSDTDIGPAWYSSVHHGVKMSAEILDESYWVDNMCNPVLFSGALASAVSVHGNFDMIIEVGPHPALKGPATANLEELGVTAPYTGVIARGRNDVDELAAFLGFLWTRLGPDYVKLNATQLLLSDSTDQHTILTDLPPYPFDHHRGYWTTSRVSNYHKNRKQPPNPILGTVCSLGTTTQDVQWRNLLRPSEISWLKGHKLQGQTVFPATGYVSMAIEAMKLLAEKSEIKYFKISNIEISRAITINDDGAGVETIFSLSSIHRLEHSIEAQFSCHTLSSGDQTPLLHARGTARVELGATKANSLPALSTDTYNLVDVATTRFYTDLSRIGYEYSPPFQGLTGIRRKPGYSTGMLTDQSDSKWEDDVVVHPGMLDSGLQAAFAALSFPGDGQLWSLHIPTEVSSIVVNPHFTPLALGKQKVMKFEAFLRAHRGSSMEADIHLSIKNKGHSFVKFEGVKLVPFSPASAANDVPMFSSFQHCLSDPDGTVAAQGETLSEEDIRLCKDGYMEKPYSWLARLTAQIGMRYPDIHILEAGAGTGYATQSILSSLGSSFSSYTFTDVSDELLHKAKKRFENLSSRMLFKTFDLEKPAAEQGFSGQQYDVIIAANVLRTIPDIEGSLANIRQLLKPGGYLLTLEISSSELTPYDKTGSALTLEQWTQVLEKTGFSGIDSAIPDTSSAVQVTVFVSRAIDDRISLLRDPMAASFQPDARRDTLTIVGGSTLPVYQLVEEITAHIAPLFGEVMVFETLEEMSKAQATLAQSMTVLNLTDLDEPYMKTSSTEKFESLKTLWRLAGPIIWVTRTAKHAEPYSYMVMGLGRAVKTEYPNINLQMFDIETLDNDSSLLLARALIRHHLLSSWGEEVASMLYSAEPEITIQQGRAMITRIIPNQEKNDRYNAQRRTVHRDINPAVGTVRLTTAENTCELQQVSPLRQAVNAKADYRTIRITHSLFRSVKIGNVGLFRLCAGFDVINGEPLVALTDSDESPAVVPSQWCVRRDVRSPKLDNPEEVLLSLAACLIAETITSLVSEGDAILIHEPDTATISILQHLAREKMVELYFTTSQPSDHANVMFVHPESSRSAIRDILPASIGAMVSFAGQRESEAVESLIASCLPARCVTLSIFPLLGNAVQSLPNINMEIVQNALSQAWSSHTEVAENSLPELLSLGDISNGSKIEQPLAIVDWTVGSVRAKVLPIDTGTLFRSDKTYWLAGMAGELGQSLCGWMVAHGAKNIVLTSRNPKVNLKFIENMRRRGANVRALSLDVTSRRSLYGCHKEILKSMPEIAGVINGAMVLQDGLFDTMTYEQFQKVIKPKVEGTKLLDELFHTTPLDFFIVTSSITSITGLTGQSNYSAANTFMTALMYQRKKRGVAGSSMVIPAVAGVGYAAQGDNFDFNYFASIGYITISEHDFRTLFAEAIISGHPESAEQAEVITGVNYVPVDVQVKEAHRRDVKFSHYIIKEEQNANSGTGKVALRVKTQIQQAKTKEDISTIIRDTFLMKLKRVLQIADEDAVDESVALVEQGVDSLVAVEIRSWFLKELEVDIPVLKVLGGSSINDLICAAVDKIPENLINLNNSNDTKPSPPTKSPPPPLPTLVHQPSSTEQAKSEPLSRVENEIARPLARTAISRSITATTASSIRAAPIFTPNLSPTLTPSSSLSHATPSSSESSPLLKPHATEDDSILELPDLSRFTATDEMSYGQTRFWFLHQLLSDKTPFNFSISACMKGPFDEAAFEKALNLVMQRHEALRTSFLWADGDMGTPIQGISNKPTIQLEKRRISSETEAVDELQRLRNHTYDLENGGAMLLKLLSLSENVHYLLVGCHHIAFDGQSTHIFMSEVDKAYRKEQLEPMLPESQYRAFAAHQRHLHEAGSMKAEIEYFRNIITNDPKPVDLFSFAKLKARKIMTTYKSTKAEMSVDVQTAKTIKQLARKLHCTNFHVYLTALQALVFRLLPENNQFFVGIADANRVDSKFIGTLGCLVNLLPIRFDRDNRSQFGDAVKSTRNRVYGALQNSQVPFDVLLDKLGVSRSGEHTPVFQIFMDYRLGDQQKTIFAGCDTEVTWDNAATGYDLQLGILDTAAGESLITLELQDSLYSQSHTELLLRTYVHFLKQLTADGVGNTILEEPTVWPQKDIAHALEVAKGPSLSLSWPPTISHRIDQIVESCPSTIAIKDGYDNVLTYNQLADRMNTIARHLKRLGVGEGTIVAVFQEPSADWMCSMLAIFRTGATYIPLDLKNGINRLIGSIGVARPHAILVDRWTADKTPELQLDGELVINVSDIQTIEACPVLPNTAKEDSIAVILFTSGSTGVPKGIELPHSCFATHAEGIEKAWSVGPNIVLQQVTLSFDLSLHQIFTALANGGTLCVVPSHQRGDPTAITQLMLEENVTYTVATPTEYRMWFQEGAPYISRCSSWRWAVGGGEALSKRTIRDFAELAPPSLRLYDFYGPAEATIGLTKGEIDYNEVDLEHALPTGHILPNYSVYILDTEQKPVPLGVPGEIVVGGPGVARGYLGLEELTAEKFISNPFGNYQSAAPRDPRLYRTGDQGWLSEDGAVYYDGRIDGDTQIKLRGIRIELGEIESAIVNTASGAISQVAVTAHGENESKFLVAYVVFSSQHRIPDHDEFLANLQFDLPIPSYMQPSQFVVIPNLPMNTHGKTDRKALRSIPIENLKTAQAVGSTANLTEIERLVAEQWGKVLPSRGIALQPETNFFHVGGNSLLLVKLQRFLKEAFGAAPRLVDLMTSSTLKEMSEAAKKASCNSKIDWRSDIVIPASWRTTLEAFETPSHQDLTIVLTGATGYLGRHILPQLVADTRVSKVICLARDHANIQEQDKVQVIVCNISEDNLGLPTDVYETLGRTADMIIHCAANRSFWDDYDVLRHINVLSVKQLVHLASVRRLPLHFFSSGAAAPVTTDGYLLSKWAAEKLLESASLQLNLPIYIHSPQAAAPGTEPTSDPAVINAFVDCARRVGARPGFDGFGGYIDLTETSEFIDKFMDSLFSRDSKGDTIKRIPYYGVARADIDSSILAKFGEHQEWLGLPTMDPLLWMGEAKRAGFPYVLVAQNLVMSSGSGQVVSRR